MKKISWIRRFGIRENMSRTGYLWFQNLFKILPNCDSNKTAMAFSLVGFTYTPPLWTDLVKMLTRKLRHASSFFLEYTALIAHSEGTKVLEVNWNPKFGLSNLENNLLTSTTSELGFEVVWPRRPQCPQNGLRDSFSKITFWNQCKDYLNDFDLFFCFSRDNTTATALIVVTNRTGRSIKWGATSRTIDFGGRATFGVRACVRVDSTFSVHFQIRCYVSSNTFKL